MNTADNKTTTPEPNVLIRQIGSTTFKVKIHFDPNAKEKLDEKILRLLKNDLQSGIENANIEPLQTEWLLNVLNNERSSA